MLPFDGEIKLLSVCSKVGNIIVFIKHMSEINISAYTTLTPPTPPHNRCNYREFLMLARTCTRPLYMISCYALAPADKRGIRGFAAVTRHRSNIMAFRCR